MSNRQADAGAEAPEKSDGPPPKPPSKWVFVIAGLVLVACLAWGAYGHWTQYTASKNTAEDTLNSRVEVRTIEAKRDDAPMTLTLPGDTQPFDTANIYARATGYIRKRLVDIGSRVKKNDLLVHIEAPDLDQQLAQANAQIGQVRAAVLQAHAQLSQAEANVTLAKATFARTNQLTQQGYESRQNNDNQQANMQSQEANVVSAKAGISVADANVQAQQATIDRLKALAAFEDVRAPFDGVITARNVDTGDLINADASTGSPMFTVARDDIIRVMVSIPQNAAIGVHDGLEASVEVPQMPGRMFKGLIQRSSEALLYSSRTLTTEVDVPNQNHALRSGLYVSVSFMIPRDHPSVTIPAEALIFDQHGMQVATVENNQIKLNRISIFRDQGTTIDLQSGLNGGEHVVLGPPAMLQDGSKVKETETGDRNKPATDQKGLNQQASTANDRNSKAAKIAR